MLIRSQNKEVLVNFNNSAGIDIEEGPMKTTVTSYITGARYLLGKYSNKQKAVKVLDMIQEAYANWMGSGSGRSNPDILQNREY